MDLKHAEYSAFISYATADRAKAEEICAHLEAHGLRCWIAPRDVRAGQEYANEIIDAIERAPVLLLVLSAAANESKFVRREVERAITKGDPVIPVRIEDVLPSSALELFVSATHWIDAWRGDWADHMDRLVRDLTERTSAPASPASPPASPASAIAGASWNARRALSGAAVLLVVAVAAGAYRYGVDKGSAPQSLNPGVLAPPASPARSVGAAAPSSDLSSGPPSSAAPAATTSSRSEAQPERVTPRRPQNAAKPQTPTPAVSAAQQAAPSPPVREPEPEGLEELRQQGAALAIRARVVDQSLSRLAEQMRPNGLRGDVLVRQQSVASSLASGQRALDRQDVAAATTYFGLARNDVEALERFLGR